MEVSLKGLCTMGLLVLAAYVMANFDRAYGANVNPCPNSSANNEAMKLWPCADAATDEKARVSPACCSAVRKLGKNKECMCAAMLSDTAKSAGVNISIAITIPKRCDIANRPIGYMCGGYSLP